MRGCGSGIEVHQADSPVVEAHDWYLGWVRHEVHHPLVVCLRLPGRRIDELYASVGVNRRGMYMTGHEYIWYAVDDEVVVLFRGQRCYIAVDGGEVPAHQHVFHDFSGLILVDADTRGKIKE